LSFSTARRGAPRGTLSRPLIQLIRTIPQVQSDLLDEPDEIHGLDAQGRVAVSSEALAEAQDCSSNPVSLGTLWSLLA